MHSFYIATHSGIMSDEEIDFEFELDQETLKQLEQGEQEYYSQVQPETQCTSTQHTQTPEIQHASNDQADEQGPSILNSTRALSTQSDSLESTKSEKVRV
jgi:hypothetical protein